MTSNADQAISRTLAKKSHISEERRESLKPRDMTAYQPRSHRQTCRTRALGNKASRTMLLEETLVSISATTPKPTICKNKTSREIRRQNRPAKSWVARCCPTIKRSMVAVNVPAADCHAWSARFKGRGPGSRNDNLPRSSVQRVVCSCGRGVSRHCQIEAQ